MKIKISVKKITAYSDLMEEFENPIEHACNFKLNDSFVLDKPEKPDGFCDSAWETFKPWVTDLFNGIDNFYDGWMKNPKSAMISCNDGFRPVSFYIEVIEE